MERANVGVEQKRQIWRLIRHSAGVPDEHATADHEGTGMLLVVVVQQHPVSGPRVDRNGRQRLSGSCGTRLYVVGVRLLQGWSSNLLLNTHLHSDHCRGNTALQQAYRCRTSKRLLAAARSTRYRGSATWRGLNQRSKAVSRDKI